MTQYKQIINQLKKWLNYIYGNQNIGDSFTQPVTALNGLLNAKQIISDGPFTNKLSSISGSALQVTGGIGVRGASYFAPSTSK